MNDAIHATLMQAAQWLGATAERDVAFTGVSVDSRTLTGGELFFALGGPNHDGHAFVAQAAQKGAAAAVVERRLPLEVPQLVVPDTRLALGRLATGWREHCATRIVGVTGSNGKTTVKEMVAAILACAGQTLATRGNLNNDIGVPLTLLRLTPEHRFAVIEMGANHPGEIAYLTALARPDVALITNAGPAHLEGFGTVAGVAQAKGEIYGGLCAGGVAVINADDPHAPLWERLAQGCRVIRFGLDQPAEVTAEWESAEEAVHLALHLPGAVTTAADVALPGRHNVMNALAASAAAVALGLPPTVIAQGLSAVRGVKGRLRFVPGLNGARLLDDTYNANPGSLRCGLEVLMSQPGRHFLALGDMAELGREADALHAESGRRAREAGVERLFTTGEHSRLAAETFGSNGVHYPHQQELVEALRRQLAPDVTLLVKGSRSAHMECVVEALAAGGEE